VNEHTHSTLTVERRDAIADLVVREGAARVSELAEQFDVSPATVRRDLEALEDRGTVKRVHGGAVALDRDRKASPASRFHKPSPPRSAKVARIGQAVAEMIEEGETVFLGPGALPLEVARSLEAHAGVTVVTNGLEIAHWLATHTKHRLIITGGQIEDRDMALVGQLTRDALSSLRADRVILELGGISAVEGLTHDSIPQAEIAQILMEAGSSVVVLVSPERVGRVAAARVAPVTHADVVVTAREAPSAYLWDLSEVGLEVVLA
jgi:DeoR/GlpR family transcriptional regulator of sugar metabolism